MWQQAGGIPAGLHLDFEHIHTHTKKHRNAAGSFRRRVCPYIKGKETGHQTDRQSTLQTEASNQEPDLHLLYQQHVVFQHLPAFLGRHEAFPGPALARQKPVARDQAALLPHGAGDDPPLARNEAEHGIHGEAAPEDLRGD